MEKKVLYKEYGVHYYKGGYDFWEGCFYADEEMDNFGVNQFYFEFYDNKKMEDLESSFKSSIEEGYTFDEAVEQAIEDSHF